MATYSLYQKYRPQTFSEVVGQDEVVKTIQNQLEKDQLSHAYLFYGTRGLGKTTTARLLAAELGINDEDLYEIDAASNRGIDDIREIREGVKSQPFSSPYKMYLIDEVHMLTKEAFNALLKTLEEPPSHTIFILATTELHKVPDTIKSRTQVYYFKQPTADELIELLNRVANAEGVNLPEEAARSIAQRANGSYRDSLSHLQIYLLNPEVYQKGNRGSFTDDIISSLNEGVLASRITDLITAAQQVSDPKQAYISIVRQTSDLLAGKVRQENDSSITSAHLSIMLDLRGNFSGSEEVIQRAGLVLLVEQLAASA